MFLALPLFLFAGRAKAEPARQTTTKRRKRKNSASSANSSVGTTAGKKRSPATNFSLSSQVPVSISSTRFASSFISFSLTPHACLQGYTQAGNIPNGIAAIRFNLFAQKREKQGEGGRENLCSETKKPPGICTKTSRHKTKRKHFRDDKERHERH